MTILVLITVLFLHMTGLWSQISPASHADLAGRVTQSTPVPTIAAAIPVKNGTDTLSYDPAESVYAIDTATQTVLYTQNALTERPIASITKLTTALVILSRHQLTDIVTIPTLPVYPTAAETLGLVAGQTYTVQDLLTAALVPSDNDAADSLAIWDSGSIDAFAKQMNAKLTAWGINGAHFSNPSGLVDDGNTVSAQSLAKIGELALKSPIITNLIRSPSATITSGQGRVSQLQSTDTLLAGGNFYGIKTGYTQAAGDCFIGVTRIDGHQVITVVLGSQDRFGDTTKLTNWIKGNWQWL